MPKIGVLNFVKRQTPESKHDHFEGSWNELIALTEANWNLAIVSPHNSQVRLVPMPHDQVHRFYGSVVKVSESTPLKAHFAPRVPGEEPFIQIEAPGATKHPARQVEIICYSHDVLEQDGDAPPTREADYYIVSINAYGSQQPEPMSPMTMARNFLGLKGGTKPELPYTAEDFAKSIVYWSQHVRVGQ